MDVPIDVQIRTDFVKGLILIHRSVDLENQQVVFAATIQVGHGDPHSLIFKRKPIRHIKPTRPAAGDIAVHIQLAPDAVKPPILIGRIVHHQNEQLQTSIAVQVRERDGAVLIFKRKPIRDSEHGPQPPARFPFASNPLPTL
jgi:hypothetical protein